MTKMKIKQYRALLGALINIHFLPIDQCNRSKQPSIQLNAAASLSTFINYQLLWFHTHGETQ